ncbi:MAG TPA: peptidoglycan editing factor PgeF [Candidatus Acidoferrales bacterium]|nr:peptidoglycan editing factor PgeF [Candidatus Acidoferrales bacterium]
MPPATTKKRSAPRARATPWKLRRAAGLRILEAPQLARLSWLTHGFSTRPGGASEMPAAGPGKDAGRKRDATAAGGALNLSFTDWDSRERVLENRAKFFRALGAAKMRVATLRQFHSDAIHRVDRVDAGGANGVIAEPAKADALFTREPDVLLAVQTADCIPILLADTKTRAIAAIHSGWRGTLARIAAKTLGRMQMEFGTRPEDVIAAIGPGIGGCCYEVGSDVAREFHSQFPGAREWFDGPFDALASGENDPNWLPWLTMRPPGHPPPAPRVHLDLIAANRAILAAAGVQPRNISASDFCTACRTDLFFSYRRERATGRLMAAIAIR